MIDLEKQFHELMKKHTDIGTHTVQNLDFGQEHYNLWMELSIAKSQIDWMLKALELLDDNYLIFRKKSEFEKLGERPADATKDQEKAT